MFWYTIQPGDTLYTLAQRCNTTAAVIARLNGIIDPENLQVGRRLRLPCAPRPQPPTPPTHNNLYAVKAGDTLYSIAKANNTTVEALVQLNRLTNPNLIFPGDRLRLK